MSEVLIEQRTEEPISEQEMPINLLLDDIITDDEIHFMNSDQATLDDIGNILEIIKNKKIKKLAFGCKQSCFMLKMDVNTLSQARKEDSEVIFTAYVLERVCSVIGSRVRRSVEELFLQSLPITLWVSLLNIHRARYLQKVSLRHCRIGDYGCKSFFKHLSPSITHIDLTDNEITKKGVYYIVDVIREQNSNNFLDSGFNGVQYLCLNCNPIRSGGLNILVDAVLSDFCLKSIELRNCDIEDVGETYVLALVNTGLEVLDLRENPVKEKHKINDITKLITQNNPPETATFKWSQNDKLYVE